VTPRALVARGVWAGSRAVSVAPESGALPLDALGRLGPPLPTPPLIRLALHPGDPVT